MRFLRFSHCFMIRGTTGFLQNRQRCVERHITPARHFRAGFFEMTQLYILEVEAQIKSAHSPF